MKVGFLGCGKIGRALVRHVLETGHQVSFVQDIFFKDEADFPVIEKPDPAAYAGTDLIVECATADALKQSFDAMIAQSDVLMFSLTAFSDEAFLEHAKAEAVRCGHHIFFPHGAILGLDGIADAKPIMTAASIQTTKSPKSLGLDLTERTVVYEGSTRGACKAFPRNVNVHAAVALAGLGFDRTVSRIVADPAVSTNAHVISIEGEGIHFEIHVSSFTTGGVTGVYTPLSACGSLDRVLGNKAEYSFI
ncbi:MAG: DUF108 domain-containing protein [Clostridiales bacterium]|nr:DUF108 domain-containing protein [Clostridiales bacterium]